jgi:predicted secreted protein
MRRTCIRRAGLLAAALLGACSAREGPPTPGAATGEVRATEAQNGGAVQVAPGSRLLVSLPANATTGFAWTVAQSPKILRRLEDDYAPAPTAGPALAGGDGVQTLAFRATAEGAGVLRLVYRQPWRGGSTGETYSLRVTSRR